jgi:integrase
VLEAHTVDSGDVEDGPRDRRWPGRATREPEGHGVTKKDAVSGPTGYRMITLLSTFNTRAYNHEMTDAHPARGATQRRDQYLLRSQQKGQLAAYLKSRADIDKLHEALKKIDRSVALAYYISLAGLRPGEVLALRWGSVDLKACSIVFERQARKHYEGLAKSGEARMVPIVPHLVESLAAWLPRVSPIWSSPLCSSA